MDIRTFYKKFAEELTRLQVVHDGLPEALIQDLPAGHEVTLSGIQVALTRVGQHMLEGDHERVYPKRISQLLDEIRSGKRFTVKRAARIFSVLISCDYLEFPRRSDWASDEALVRAFSCGVLIFFFTLQTQTSDIVLQAEQALRALEVVLSPEFREVCAKKIGNRPDAKELVERAIESLVYQTQRPSAEELELIVDRVIHPQDPATLN